jgi:competence protein ComGC
MEKKVIVIISVLTLLLLASLTYIGIETYNKNITDIGNEAYQMGVKDCDTQVTNGIISELNTKGYLDVTLPLENNKTIKIKLIPQIDNSTQN